MNKELTKELKELNLKFDNHLKSESERISRIELSIATLCEAVSWLKKELESRKAYRNGRDIAIISAVVGTLIVNLMK